MIEETMAEIFDRIVASPDFGPNKKASNFCESGKRDFCTCDACF
jgi:hypothetical protein